MLMKQTVNNGVRKDSCIHRINILIFILSSFSFEFRSALTSWTSKGKRSPNAGGVEGWGGGGEEGHSP